MKKDDLKLGATGRFPEGKLDTSDQGELRAAISTQNNFVRIDFGKPVTWLSMPPGVARVWARELLRRADVIDGGASGKNARW